MKPVYIRYRGPIELQIYESWCHPLEYSKFTDCLVDAVLQPIRLKIQNRLLRMIYGKNHGKIRLTPAEAYALWHRVAHFYKPDTGYELSLFVRKTNPLHQYMLTHEINNRYGS